jgi:hypothetical protein
MKTERRKQINVKKILKSNPHIDKELYETIQKQQNELKALGFKRAKYNLVTPFVRRVQINEKTMSMKECLEYPKVDW